jgi:hypothetical protein
MMNAARYSMLLGFGFRLVAFGCLALAPVSLRAGDMAPDFAKLAPMAACPVLADVARAGNLPLSGIDPPGEAGSLNVGDSVTALVTLFEKGRRPAQWLLEVDAVAPDAGEPSRKPQSPWVWYTCAGDKIEFASAQAPVSLRLLGPYAEAGGKAPKAKERNARGRRGHLPDHPDQIDQSVLGQPGAVHRSPDRRREEDGDGPAFDGH